LSAREQPSVTLGEEFGMVFKKRSVVLFALFAVVAFLSANASALACVRYTDNFNDGVINTSLWAPVILGTGPSYVETNGRLEVTVPASSQNNPAAGGFGAFLNFNKSLTGDFDATVDYTLLTYPTGNALRLGFAGPLGGVERISLSPAEQLLWGGPDVYVTDFTPVGGSVFATSTAATRGTLRFTRAGNTLSGYRKDACGRWVQISSQTGPAVPGTSSLAIGAWGHDGSFSQVNTKIALDNFSVKVHWSRADQLRGAQLKGGGRPPTSTFWRVSDPLAK
jgi:hypothetical protein